VFGGGDSGRRANYRPNGRRGAFRDQVDATVFQRGNIHTHSTESDGDSAPEDVYAWYRDHGYNFLALTDHNKLTDPGYYRNLERPGFVIIPGEEITLKVGKAPVHVNALCHRRRIGGHRVNSIAEALRWSVAKAVSQNGVALVNHPNFHWAFGAEALGDANGARLLEIWSGHPNVNPDGDNERPSVEAMWDAALTAGMDFAGVAVDDMHKLGAERDLRRAGPGRGWIDVFARSANEAEICDALRRGGLIASSGVRIARFTVWNDTMTVVAQAPGGTVEFIGNDGSLLSRQNIDSYGRPNTYRLRGGEQYVRARVTAPGGARAWTQAYRVVY
jgi:hypothetical protein